MLVAGEEDWLLEVVDPVEGGGKVAARATIPSNLFFFLLPRDLFPFAE